jgi:hypothetical protein
MWIVACVCFHLSSTQHGTGRGCHPCPAVPAEHQEGTPHHAAPAPLSTAASHLRMLHRGPCSATKLSATFSFAFSASKSLSLKMGLPAL